MAGLALFAVSPVPSAQLFEAAGLMSVRLLPLTAAFFVGRTVSYAFYASGAEMVRDTDTGHVLLSWLTSPWGGPPRRDDRRSGPARSGGLGGPGAQASACVTR